MPLVAPPRLQRYEAGLKELLARHGLGGNTALDSLRLAEVAVDVTTLLSVEFEVVRTRAQQNITEGARCLPATTCCIRKGTLYFTCRLQRYRARQIIIVVPK